MQRERILVLEGTAEGLVEALQKEGFEVVVARDRFTVLEEVKRNSFDLCLLSDRQEVNNGKTLAKAVRDLRPSIPIIFARSNRGIDDVLAVMKTGSVGFLGDNFPVLLGSNAKRDNLTQKFGQGNCTPKNKPNILVVEEDDIIREGVTSILDCAGLSCKTASSASSAISMVEREHFNLIITDLRIPEIEDRGIIIKRIKNLLPDIVNIIATSWPGVERAVEAVKHSVFDYIVEPIKPKVMARRAKANWEEHRHCLLIRQILQDIIKQLLQQLRTCNMELEKLNKEKSPLPG